MYYSRLIFLIFQLILLAGCQRFYQPQNIRYAGYSIVGTESQQDSLQQLIIPYRDSVNEAMSDTIGMLNVTLEKKLPDGSLGNFLADAYLQMAKTKWNSNAAIAFMNNGGIRVNTLAAGPLKRSSVYEVMPFDNEMILIEVNGSILKEYLDVIANEGGGGVAGIRFSIRQKKATDIFIGDQPLDLSGKYLMVNSDYVVNGGGGFNGFKELPRNRTGYLLRDAILEYIGMFTKRNVPIHINSEKRIMIEN